uniref:Uncharacterized protein n=1 Tax=Oryzias latipes TaxID=8090 RepID=A0A3B3I7C7_ORYLA
KHLWCVEAQIRRASTQPRSGADSFTTISSCLNYTKAKSMTFKCASHLKHFNCAGFTHLREFLISGGDDGVLRIWVLDKKFCQHELRAHCSPIVSVKYSVSERTFFSVSTDKNVRIWNELDLTCLQSFFVDCLKTKTISAVCYEEHNNELVLADKELARCLGQGTDVFKQRIPSHDQPLWDVIYNSQFKQLVSLSLDACIRVWDILTGEFLLEFSALSNVFMKPVAIMFDPTNRKLLALSKDKEIAYWNFNNGKEIEVLPLKVPNHVTGLIQERDTLFISALNCKTIFFKQLVSLSLDAYTTNGLQYKAIRFIPTNVETLTTVICGGEKGCCDKHKSSC